MSVKQPTFGSKLGLILATVGSSVGLGNIWRFPYTVGENGGAAYVLLYFLLVLLLGIPIVVAEFSVGRRSGRSVATALESLSGSKRWNVLGWLSMLAAFAILSFYSVVVGWTLEYVLEAFQNGFVGKGNESLELQFSAFTNDPFRPLLWTLLGLILTFWVVSRGVNMGIERFSNILMPILFSLLVGLAVYSLTLPGAGRGIRYLFSPDWGELSVQTFLGAMGQAFFSLSIGMGCLLTYASYFRKDVNLLSTAFTVAGLDTLVALISGLIIFPAVFSYGIDPSAGPELVFITLPHVFAMMPGGYVLSIAFFLLISIAAVTSTISVAEVIVAFLIDKTKMSRGQSSLFIFAIVCVTAMFSSLSIGIGKDVTLFGKNLFDLLEFTASNVLLPLCGLLLTVYVGWFMDRRHFHLEVTNEGGIRLPLLGVIFFLLRYVCPVAIVVIFLAQVGVV